MRRLAISMLLIAFAALGSAWCQSQNQNKGDQSQGDQGKDQSIGQSKNKDQIAPEVQSRIDAARPEDRAALYVQAAQSLLRLADTLYTEGKTDEARAAVGDVVIYCQKASDAAIQSKKHMKNVEIAARKMAARLRDIKRTLNFEDQPPVEQAIQSLEDVRTALLKEMFKKEKK
jgi:nitrate reductase cytochrome c-type subunit